VTFLRSMETQNDRLTYYLDVIKTTASGCISTGLTLWVMRLSLWAGLRIALHLSVCPVSVFHSRMKSCSESEIKQKVAHVT